MNQLIKSRHYTAWQLLKLYWQSEQRVSAYIFFVIVMLMTICLVGFDVIFSYWFNYFYNALQAYDKRTTIYLLVFFCILAAFNIVVAVYRYYISQLFGLRWRRWLTYQFINRWLSKRDYYYLENFDEHTDNPDQRIQDDIFQLVSSSLTLFVGIISAITTFIGFIYVLWGLSGEINLSLGILGTWHIPGYLVWVAVVYSTVGTYVTFKIGHPLVSLNFEQQRREATFRFAAIDVRSHAEHVALYRGEKHQKGILNRLFSGVLENYYFIILRQKIILWFTLGFNQTAVVLPLLVALPNYFGRVFMLGGLMQSLRAFSSLQEALAFLVNSFTQIAEWRAVMQRLTTFVNHMQTIDDKVKTYHQLILTTKPKNKIVAKQLSIYTPRDEVLLKNINEELIHGQHYLIKGVSGIGKSTFVRTIAGIWPFAIGEIDLPDEKKILYLPQKPYMPIGSLAEALMFPDKIHIKTALHDDMVVHDDERKSIPVKKASLLKFLKQTKQENFQDKLKQQLMDMLRLCRLDNLALRLDEVATWSSQLSPGEQQRIAFVRVLLHKPDWVFLDESTSMLDLDNEKYLYGLLRTQLPHCSIVSVGHRLTLDSMHDHVINMAKYI